MAVSSGLEAAPRPIQEVLQPPRRCLHPGQEEHQRGDGSAAAAGRPVLQQDVPLLRPAWEQTWRPGQKLAVSLALL